MSSSARLHPFFTFYGGKYRVAPRYPFPAFPRIIEPFAGSAGYALRHYHHNVVLYDADPVIANLWKFLIRVTPEEILRIPVDIDTVDDIKGPEEARYLVGFWFNKGSSRPCRTPSSWMRGGTHPNSYWGKVIRQRIAGQVDSIKHWKCYHKSYARIKVPGKSTWFVDPPYRRSGKHYRCADIDYLHLAGWIRALPGQRIVCEEQGADWLPFSPFNATKASPGKQKGSAVSEEVLWYSYPRRRSKRKKRNP